MPKRQTSFLRDRLHKTGIRHFDELIHDQSKEWLLKHFSRGADEYPVNISLLMRNIIWQTVQIRYNNLKMKRCNSLYGFLDPADASEDLDNDGLTNQGEQTYSTNPRKEDTDDDGISNKDEIYPGHRSLKNLT